jgi:GH15 family glucan-1,4-alpha-glucosidase
LIAPDGGVEWLCLPRFDSPSIFGAILDREAGRFRLAPAGSHLPVSRRYEPGTNILETTWMTDSGWLVVRDLLTIGDRRQRPADHHPRAASEHDAERLLLRIAVCTQGEVEIEASCDAAPDYARKPIAWEPAEAALRARLEEGIELRLAGDLAFEPGPRFPQASCRLREGEARYCALGWGDAEDLPGSIEDAWEKLQRTSDAWREWLAKGRFPEHEWRHHVQRSALVLKGLTYAPTGAIAAAATTSLPETPGGERNWDYRFSWIRDSSFALWGLHSLGLDDEARDFIAFFADVCRDEGPGLQIMYGLGGEKDLTEQTLEHLSGYQGSRPVRIGNAAFSQRQNDVYGALLDSVYIHSKQLGEISDELWELLVEQVEEAERVWRDPDQGIWEVRGPPQHFVSSKLMCWVALDRGSRLARRRGDARFAGWAAAARELREEILERGISERGVFRQHYGSDALDASSLLVPLVRFLPPDDPRVRATVEAISEELTAGGLVLRYRVDETDDGLSGAEGTFAICSFWLVSALSEIGERRRARVLCERLLTLAGPLGLYAEEIEPASGRQLGNFPQAFTHLGLINAVLHVIDDDDARA